MTKWQKKNKNCSWIKNIFMIINPVRFKIHANFANVIHKIYSIIIFVWKLISKFFNKSQKIYKLNNALLNIERILYFYFCYKLSVITFFSCIKLLYLSIIVCLEYIMKTTGLTITDKGLLSLMMQMFKGYCCEWFATSPFKQFSCYKTNDIFRIID